MRQKLTILAFDFTCIESTSRDGMGPSFLYAHLQIRYVRIAGKSPFASLIRRAFDLVPKIRDEVAICIHGVRGTGIRGPVSFR